MIEHDPELIRRLLRDVGPAGKEALDLLREQLGRQDLDFYTHPPSGEVRSLPVKLGEKMYGYIGSAVATEQELNLSVQWLAHWLGMEERMTDLRELAQRDPVTGLWNRRYFDQAFPALLERAVKENFRVTVMVYDLDNFKAYNDTYGHAAGDEILRQTANLMLSLVRPYDIVARLGGDEFAVIFWDKEPPRKPGSEHPRRVFDAAERFRLALKGNKFPKLTSQAPGTLTVSGGLAGFAVDGTTVDELMACADKLLRESKKQGKNVMIYGRGVIT